MKTRTYGNILRAAMAAAVMMLCASAQELTMTVDASKTGPPINKFIYGQFTENANNNFYHTGLWAEMVEDRKFYYPVASAVPEQAPANAPRRPMVRWLRWRPVGGDAVVTMDPGRAYSGKHSPKIALDPATPHGIQQTGLGVKKGTKYDGRIVLAADSGVQVQVSLIWGEGAAGRQTLRITGIGREYRKFPLSVTAAADSDQAALEIVGTGQGSFHVGAVSLMPADNIHGWRADMMTALKEIGPTMIRLGGNFVSNYEWRDGIGDPDKRPSRYDNAWRNMETNDVGTDEFLELCRILGAEPYITVNAGFGDAHSAAQWLEYVNGAAATPMGRLRAANGHPQPYNVKWWNIGNEMYGPWQMGNMQLRQYTIKHNMFAEAMREVDPTIKIVAVGATPAEMGTTGSAKAITGKAVAEYGGPADWNGAMLADSVSYFDALAEHLYPKANLAFDVEKQEFVPVEESLADHARRLPNRVKCAVEAWEEYQKRFPKLDMKSIPIALDEWAPGNPGVRSSMFNALSSAEALHELFRNSGWFVMSEYTHLTGLVIGSRTEMNVLPSGKMFQLYRRHFGVTPVAVTGNSPQPDVKGLAGLDKPRVPSGSDTYPLDAAAALAGDGKTLTVAIVNPTESEQRIAVKFQGVALQASGKLWRIAAPDMTSQNLPGRPPAIDIVQSALTSVPETLVIPKLSISIYELPVR
jgi:alpha-N-arabinofuranosidase